MVIPDDQHLTHLTISHRWYKPDVKIKGNACELMFVSIIQPHFKRVRTLHFTNLVKTQDIVDEYKQRDDESGNDDWDRVI